MWYLKVLVNIEFCSTATLQMEPGYSRWFINHLCVCEGIKAPESQRLQRRVNFIQVFIHSFPFIAYAIGIQSSAGVSVKGLSEGLVGIKVMTGFIKVASPLEPKVAGFGCGGMKPELKTTRRSQTYVCLSLNMPTSPRCLRLRRLKSVTFPQTGS